MSINSNQKILGLDSNDSILISNLSLVSFLRKTEVHFLKKLHHLLTSSPLGEELIEREGRRWVYHSQKKWVDRMGDVVSFSTFRRMSARLEKLGIIKTDNFNEWKFNNTKWYTIDYEVLKRMASGCYGETI